MNGPRLAAHVEWPRLAAHVKAAHVEMADNEMADNWRDKVGALLKEARELPPERREAFLKEQCEDQALRKEVLSLLEADEEAEGFFEGLAGAVVAPLLSGFQEAEEAIN